MSEVINSKRKVSFSPRPQKSSSQLQSQSAIITPPPAVRFVSASSSSSDSSKSSKMTSTDEEAKEVSIWRCDVCKDITFSTLKEAERHEDICRIRKNLESIDLQNTKKDDHEKIMNILLQLNAMDDIITTDMLLQTNIGKTVTKLRKDCMYPPVVQQAGDIVNKWKKIRFLNDQKLNEKSSSDAKVYSNKSVFSIHEDTIVNNDTENTSRSTTEPPQYKKRKMQPKTTAPIFQQAKLKSKANISKPLTDSGNIRENYKQTSKIPSKSKPLASIFTRKETKPDKTLSSNDSVESHRELASTTIDHKPDTITLSDMKVCGETEQLDSNTCLSITDEAMLAEHRKAEFLMKRRKAEEERRMQKKKRKNENSTIKKSKVGGCTAMASIFQPKVKGNSKQTMTSKSIITPKKSCNIKGSGNSGESPLDLTEITPMIRAKGSTLDRKIRDDKPRAIDLRISAPKFPTPNHVFETNYDEKGTIFLPSHTKESIRKTPRYQSGTQIILTNTTWDGINVDELTHGDHQHESDHLHYCLSSILQPSPRLIDDEYTSCPKQWCDKYKMNTVPHDIYGENNKVIADDLLSFVGDWKNHRQQAIIAAELAHQKRNGRKKKKATSKKTRYDSDDDFLSDSDDEGGLAKVYILCGPVGCGKTSLVYAAAKKSNCIVLEINTTDDRGGVSLKKAMEECTQSHSSLALLKHRSNFFSDDTCLQDSDDEEESKSSLALILIDEVDLLFESDNGFWQSLGNLTKKAKCPIILTAENIPQQLQNSTSILYKFAYLTRPTPMECASKMCQIAKMENMTWKQGLNGQEIKEGLANIAKICSCDLRRIMHEMQSYNNGSTYKGRNIPCHNFVKTNDHIDPKNQIFPSIDNISPKEHPSRTHTIIKIKGKHFRENSFFLGGKNITAEISVGGQQCPAAQIIDDNTILAVCPPCMLPNHVDNYGLIRNTINHRSYQYSYPNVTLRLLEDSGISFNSESPLGNAHFSPLLCYIFPEEGDDDTNDEELLHCYDNEGINGLLNDAIVKYKNKSKYVQTEGELGNHVPSSLKVHEGSSNNNLLEMKNLMKAAEYSSDAAVLEEKLSQFGCPSLSGTVLCCSESENNSAFDSITNRSDDHFFGCPDTFVTRPVSRRDRYLYSATCELARGRASFDPELIQSKSAPNIDHQCFYEDDNDVDYLFMDVGSNYTSEEDQFLTSPHNLCAEMIPKVLRNSTHLENKSFSPLSNDKNELIYHQERNDRCNKMLQLVEHLLYEGSLPSTNSFLSESIRSNLSLDYIPTLRNMAVIEKKAMEEYEKLKSTLSSHDELLTSRSRRRTRNRGDLERDHYFKDICNYVEIEPKEIGEQIAEMKLMLK